MSAREQSARPIDEMASENLLVRKQGKGTYVASHNDPRALFRFLRLVPVDGDLAHPQSVPLIAGRPRPVMKLRGCRIELGAPVTILRRLLRFSGKPVVVDEIYLPGEIFQGLTMGGAAGGSEFPVQLV